MPNVAVNRIADVGKTPAPLLEEIQDYFERVRRRAFEIFENCGAVHGHDVEHWLEAEREVRGPSIPEVVERDKEFEVTVPAPALEPTAIDVNALPGSITIIGKTAHRREKQEAGARFSESRSERLFYCVNLPEPIDVNSASATLEKGVLRIVARKASKPLEIQAAAQGMGNLRNLA